jgi:anti-anti-sigma factor
MQPVVPKFELSERNFWPGCHEIEVVGELDLTVSDELGAALDRAVARRLHVLLDLGACEFIDVSAVTVLVRGQEKLKAHGSQLLLYGVDGQVGRMLSATGLAGANHGSDVVLPAQVQERRSLSLAA